MSFSPTSTKQVVILLGPSCDEIGGIQTVIRTYLSWSLDGYEFIHIPTWVSKRESLVEVAKAVGSLFSIRGMAAETICHFHLSHKGSMIREGLLAAFARLLGFRMYATVHGSQFAELTRTSKFWRYVEKQALSSFVRIGVLNQESLAAVGTLGLGERTRIIPNPSPIAPSSLPSESISVADSLVTVFAGTIGTRKGVDVLLDAWRAVQALQPRAVLEICGPIEPGFSHPELESYYRGELSHPEVVSRLAKARIAVLPSRAEAMPMFVLEALALGRCLVVTDVGAMKSQVGQAGIVVEAGNSQMLSSALLQLLSDDDVALSTASHARNQLPDQKDSWNDLVGFYSSGAEVL